MPGLAGTLGQYTQIWSRNQLARLPKEIAKRSTH
jgi:hypothetical protein